MFLDMDELRRLNLARLVNLVRDPTSGLIIADYAARAQYDNAWDAHPVLLDCRGTILSEEGAVVAKPFRKFFNLGERPETQIDQVLGLGEPEVTHKLDGSMATLFYSAPERVYRLATRGSFISSQAVHATSLWRARHDDARIDPALTYIFEVLYPANRIVVDYGDRDDLVLIGLVETESGRELPYGAIETEAIRLSLPYVALECGVEWTTLHARDRQNFEGFVLFWPEQQMRVKVKLAEYLRLHRLISGIHEHAVWEMLRDGADLDAVRMLVSEEIRDWIDQTAAELRAGFDAMHADVAHRLDLLRAEGLDPADRGQRAQIARLVQAQRPAALIPILFLALDGKEYRPLIWRQIEPLGIGRVPAIDMGG